MSLITRRSAALSLFLTPFVAHAQPAPVSDREWKSFLDWTNALPPDSVPPSGGAVFNVYKAKLIGDGLAAADADQVIERLRKRANSSQNSRSSSIDCSPWEHAAPQAAVNLACKTVPRSYSPSDRLIPELRRC